MNIKVIGTGCDKCDALYANVQEAVANLGLQADIENIFSNVFAVSSYDILISAVKSPVLRRIL